MNSDLGNLCELNKILESDVKLSVEKVNGASADERSFYVRAYLRSFASWCEGTLYLHKNVIANFEGQWHLGLPTECQLYLHEADWSISGSGEPRITDKKIKTRQNLKAFFVVSQKLFPEYEVNFGEYGWECVLRFYNLRDAMMHPSNAESLNPDMQEIDACEKGRGWLSSEFRKVRDGVIKKIRE